MGETRIAVIGEALIDVVETGDDEPRLARPGGSPYNVAIGLARLGQRVAFVGRLSRDPLGAILRRHAERSAVDLTLAVDALEPTTIALVELSDGIAGYHFGVDGTADFAWTDAELAAVPADVDAVHFGSLASWTPPGDAAVLRRVAALREHALVSYDPNVRPGLQPDAAAARDHVERAVALAHVVKASEEDLAWIHPGADVAEIAGQWLTLGPAVVVVTRGSDGAQAYTAAGTVIRAARRAEVVDTVGAGDAFTSGLLDALARRDLLSPAALTAALTDLHLLDDVLDEASLVSAITCSRAGANPPRLADLETWRQTG
ncbi:MAG: carbohydrate kinase [Jatrophihabitans sp.]